MNAPVSARLFQLLEAETHVLKKTGAGNAFGSAKTQLFEKSCVLGQGWERAFALWSSGGP